MDDISRMLVITLRMVTLAAPCRCCSASTIRSAVVPWAISDASSQRKAAATAASSARRRRTNCTAKAIGKGQFYALECSPAGVVADAEQAIRHRIGVVACRLLFDHGLGKSTQIFDQHHTQGDRHRPKLANRQWLDALIGAQEAAQRLRVEAAIRVRDERPGQAIDRAEIP